QPHNPAPRSLPANPPDPTRPSRRYSKMRLRRLRRYLVPVAALVLSAAGLGGLAVAGAGPASAATGCSVDYTIQSPWNTGFVTQITITNLGSPITAWTLAYSYSGNQQLSNGWSG